MDAELGGRNLIFLISQPRAGSTLLQRILAGHPAIHTLPEPWIMLQPMYLLHQSGLQGEFDTRMARFATSEFTRGLPEGDQALVEALRRMGAYLYERALAGTGKQFFLDKTPRYYFVIPELQRVFPQAKFIFLLRQPLAVLASILDTWVKDNWVRLAVHRHDLVTAPRLIAEGIDLLKEAAIVVRYESLISEPEATVKRLCGDLGIEYDAGMIEYGNRPMANVELGDKTNVDRFSAPSSAGLNKWVERLALPHSRYFAESYLADLGPSLLDRLGYSLDDSLAQLRARPVSRPLMLVSWRELLRPPEERSAWQRARLRLAVALKQRGLGGILAHGFRKLTGAATVRPTS